MHTAFTILINIIQMTKKWTEVTCEPTFMIGWSTVCVSIKELQIKYLRKEAMWWSKAKKRKKTYMWWKKGTCVLYMWSVRKYPSSKNNHDHLKIWWPLPLPFCGRHKEITAYLEILSWARNCHFKEKWFPIAERVSLKQKCS